MQLNVFDEKLNMCIIAMCEVKHIDIRFIGQIEGAAKV